MYRVDVRLDSGRLKTVEQSDVSALSVGQRVRLQDDRVVPQ
jgi:outer membrane lipoprotein SlyB